MNQSIDSLHSCFFCFISWLRDWTAATLSNWRITAYNIVLVLPYINMNQHWYTCSLPPESPSHLPLHPIPLNYHRALGLSSLSCTRNSPWLSLLHMVMYMFQCCSLNSSHPLLPKLCSGVCSLCLHLHCFSANKFISTIVLIYVY